MKLLLALMLFSMSYGILPTSPNHYSVQVGTPVFLPNFIDVEAGCSWAGVAGQVFDENAQPAWGLLIRIYGILEGQIVEWYTVSGAGLQVGPGGFEVTLANHLMIGQTELLIQLLDVSGRPLIDAVNLPFGSTCDQNLTLVNFSGVAFDYEVYFPLLP